MEKGLVCLYHLPNIAIRAVKPPALSSNMAVAFEQLKGILVAPQELDPIV
jgi:hypothetical protein